MKSYRGEVTTEPLAGWNLLPTKPDWAGDDAGKDCDAARDRSGATIHGTCRLRRSSSRSERKTISRSLSPRASSSAGTATGPRSKSFDSASSRVLGEGSPSF